MTPTEKAKEIEKEKMFKDLFPEKKFIFTKINGIEYISKDIFEELMKQTKQDFKEKIKKLSFVSDKGNRRLVNVKELLKSLGEK